MTKQIFSINQAFYKDGEAIICNSVLNIVKSQVSKSHQLHTFTAQSKIFTDVGLSVKDLALVIYAIRTNLLVPFSYDILLDQQKETTIGDLAHSIWKSMLKSMQYN
ncbi:hypothetical protein BH11BAC3_BH11BAC3_28730 [soil metagenome]